MKRPQRPVFLAIALAAAAFVLIRGAAEDQKIYTKVPWAVGFAMEGTVTNVSAGADHIQFQCTGWFWFHQYPWGGTNHQIVKVDGQRGIPVSITPGPFVAMTSDWDGGAVRNETSELARILTQAATRGTRVKFALTNPKLDFGTNGLSVLDAKVWRITDSDLK